MSWRTKEYKPQWQIRLEINITKLQKMIRQITAFMTGECSQRLMNNIHPIFKKLSIKKSAVCFQFITANTQAIIANYLDTQKQLLQAKSARLSCYLKATQRKTQNKMFQRNPKQFYHELPKKYQMVNSN